MRIGRVAGMTALLMLSAATVTAQQEGGSAEVEARSRELSERMRVTLEQQARALSQMQRDLQLAARSDSRMRDSIVRNTQRRIAELASVIASVQGEAELIQFRAIDGLTRTQLRTQISSARAMANVTRVLAGQGRALTFGSRSLPRGYLGVTLSGVQNTELRNGNVYTLYESPTRIESVEAGSPAANAGLESGDTILAFGRITLPGAVPLGELLTPGERLTMKVRRDGREKQITVLVGTREFGTGTFSLAYPEASEGPGPGFRFDINGATVRACNSDDCDVSVTTSTTRSGERPARASVPRAPRPPSPSPSVPSVPPVGAVAPVRPEQLLQRGSSWSSAADPIAGAMMMTITEELEDLTGVDEGILVLRVAPGTPAATSGLRGGDIILRINDEDSEGVRDLQRAMQRTASRGGRELLLTVSRQRKERQIKLQW